MTEGSRLSLGAWGEEVAAQFLTGQGYIIIDRNFSCRYGEIDIIAKKDRFLVFVEVKQRKNTVFGYPREAVTPAKQHRLRQAAICWFQASAPSGLQPRFDIIEILAPQGTETKTPRITHLTNAF